MSSTKRCRVCGANARGFNYDALSCESCKIFFYRNSFRLKSFRCDFSGNCEIDVSTRTNCPKCRLIKCFAIGMKKKLENQEEQSNCILTIERKISNGIEHILENLILKHISEYDIIQIPVPSQNNTQQKKHLPPELRPYEQDCIVQVRNAIGIFRYERTAQAIKRIKSVQELSESPAVHNLLYIKKAINFCQNFSAFNSLSCEDQLELLKPFYFKLISIWFTFQYEAEQKGILMYTDESETNAILIGHELMAECYGNPEIIQQLSDGSIAFHNAMENDVNIRNLLTAIVLFKTKRNLSCPENIRYHYYLYCAILQSYLQYKHRNKKVANRKYLQLMCHLDEFEFYFQKQQNIMKLSAQGVPKIFLELYDLV